jgi:hypothetical protein
VDPVPFPLTAVALGGEQIAGDQSGRFVLEREHPPGAARDTGAVRAETLELLLGELRTLVLRGVAVVRVVVELGLVRIARTARELRIRRVLSVRGVARIAGVLGIVERGIVVSERLVVLTRAASALVVRFARLARAHQEMLSDEVREEGSKTLRDVADCAAE